MLTYIHIPYCDSKCHYCAFNSYVGRFDTKSRYMEALYRQGIFEIDRFDLEGKEIETLFIGGGTPSTVDPELYGPVFELLSPYFSDDIEITTEANPNSATPEWIDGMRRLGVNRISFGVQSFERDKLKSLGRAHSPEDAIESIANAHKAGFEHISLDLIYNYRGDTQELLGRDIEKAFDLPIDHISAYELTIESNTPFADMPDVRQDNDSLAFYVAQEITSKGFVHYEISNFGRYQSRHNIGYWQQKDYMGLGAGAVGFLKNSRYYPPTDIDRYINDPLDIKNETITADELLTEMVFLGLRSNVGLEIGSLEPYMVDNAKLLLQEGKLGQKNGRFYNNNFFLADEIALFILNKV